MALDPQIAAAGPGDPPRPDAGLEKRPRHRARTALAVVGLLMALLLAIVIFVAAKPVDLPRAAAAPDPSGSYADALQRIDDVAQREAAMDLLPACRSKLLTTGARSDRAIVLLHGYTNCPAMFERFGEELLAEGYNVYIPLAPDHGEADREHSSLGDLTAEKLMAYGNEAVDIAAGLGDSVTVLGLSGGGSVAAYLAQTRDDVDLGMPVSPFLGLKSVPPWLTPGLVNLADLIPPIAWGIPSSASSSGTYAPYASLDNNSRAAAAYIRLGLLTRSEAATDPHAARRVVIVTNVGDDTVSNDIANELTDRWRSLAPGATDDYRFPAEPPLPHDLIGPDRIDQRTDVVYPVLLDLIGAR